MRGDYHEYNLPDSDQEKPGTAVQLKGFRLMVLIFSKIDRWLMGLSKDRKTTIFRSMARKGATIMNITYQTLTRSNQVRRSQMKGFRKAAFDISWTEQWLMGLRKHRWTRIMRLPMLQKKVGDRTEAGDNAYQHLHTTDDESYTPLHLKVESATESTKTTSKGIKWCFLNEALW